VNNNSAKTPYLVETHIGLTRYKLPAMPVWHGFFARTGGVSTTPYAGLNTAYITEDPRASQNRDLLYQTLHMENSPIRILNPCHGNRIAFVDESAWQANTNAVLYKTDGAFTRTAGSYFLMSTADCIPAIFSDTQGSFVGLIHLGWRNIMAHFTETVVNALQTTYGVAPRSLVVGIGPAIYPCCYHIKAPQQRHDPFWRPFLTDCGDDIYQIDLISAFKTQLQRGGIEANHVYETQLCTGCHKETFFSCYKEGYVSGRFPTVAGLQKHHKKRLGG
jgi:YfiH family protein